MSRAWQSPLPYPGSKRRAVYQLSPLVPREINRVVSPFFGGGSFELFLLASRGDVSIVASDGFLPLVNFWSHAVSNAGELAAEVLSLYKDATPGVLWGWYRDLEVREPVGDIGGVRDAAKLFILIKRSFSQQLPAGPTGVSLDRAWDVRAVAEVLRAFGRRAALSRLSLACQDVFEVLARETDAFLFCDPPYHNHECLYGFSVLQKSSQGETRDRAGRWSSGAFPHDNLADALRSHRGGFVLTYNDCPEVRELYEWALVEELVFPYSARRGTRPVSGEILGREVVIRAPGAVPIEEIKKARPPAVRWTARRDRFL